MMLQALRSPKGCFNLVELDYTPKMASALGIDLSFEENLQLLNEILIKLADVFIVRASGLVLDPIYSFFLLEKIVDLGLILRLEQEQVEVDPLCIPKLIPNWGVENIKNNYGVVKLELYYHPNEQEALIKKQLVAELFNYCFQERVAFILKLKIYTPANEKPDAISFQQAQLQAIDEFRSSCDLLALQYPQDPLTCATITSELDIPWILMADNLKYTDFKEMLRTALENGASGFLAGDVFWKEMYDLKDDSEAVNLDSINKFIETTVRDRLIEITRIGDELANSDKD